MPELDVQLSRSVWLTSEWLDRLSVEMGVPIAGYDTLPSTMARAADYANHGAGHGATVLARTQTEGRGRRGRVWASPPGHLYLSQIWRLTVDPTALSVATLQAGLAVAEAIETCTGLTTELKWPNDVKLSGAKCAGVLATLVDFSGSVATVVVGVGVDVQPLGPEHAGLIATSLSEATGRPMGLEPVAEAVIRRLADRGRALVTDGFDRSGWLARCRLFGRLVEVSPPGALPWRGTAHSLSERGELLVTRDGQTEAVLAGDVVLVDESPRSD